MKNINEKTKRKMTIAGGIVISLVLIFLIGGQFKSTQDKEDINNLKANNPTDIIVDEGDCAPEKIYIPENEISENNADNGAVDKGAEQKIQGDVVKPEYTEEQLTNPEMKPNGQKVTQITAEEHNEISKLQGVPKNEDIAEGGSVNSKGQTYMPGFGWITSSGENKGNTVDSDGDINKQIGEMN